MVLNLRHTVMALVASGAAVLVLTGITAGMFSTPPADPLVPQANPVDQHAVAQQPNLLPEPAPAAQPAPAPQPAPEPQPATDQQPDVVAAPVAHTAPAVHPQPATHPPVVRTPVHPQPVPAPDPVPIAEPAPNHHEMPSRPGPEPSPRLQKSRTVNTEPCACDGTMRKVPTHWDPPQD